MSISLNIITKCPRDGHEFLRFGIELWKRNGKLRWYYLPKHTCPICNTQLIRKPQEEIDRFFEPTKGTI